MPRFLRRLPRPPVFLAAALLVSTTAPLHAQLPTPTCGWNLGNTLEPPSGEGSWGPPATQKLINAVADAGFNTVRIPCAWNSHADPTSYQIDATYMARVKQVVDWCVARKLYVIVNCHWDGGWLENNIADAVDPTIDAKMKSYWTQIATTFRDYDDHLLFAGANEPNAGTAAKWATLRSYYNTFIAAVRAVGGNNTSRWLVVQGPNTNIDLSDQLVTSLPDDSTPGRLAFEVHYYDPFQFTGLSSDASWGKMFYFWGQNYHSTTLASRNATWGEEDYVDAEMQKISRKFVAAGVPVIVGEFQAMKRAANSELSGANLDLHIASRLHFHDYVVRAANRYGLKPIYWDIAGQLFDWTTGAVLDPDNLRILTQAVSTPTYSGAKQVFFRTGDIAFTPSFSGTVTQYAATGLPAGLAIDAATGTISGRVAEPQTATVTLTASGNGTTATQQLTMNFTPGTLSDSRLVNISLRSNTSSGEKIATAGISITGNKLLLARLSGPALVPFGVTGTLEQPVLKLYQGQTLLATYGAEKDSSDPVGIAQASDYAGAFPFPSNATDAAVVLPLSAGSYSLQAIGANDASGVGLIELYDLDRGTGRIVNLSTRGEVGAGSAVMIDGVTVDGPAPRTFLVRAAGPALGAFGIGGVLSDPKLTVYDQRTKAVIATNDNWEQGQDAAAIVAANNQVSAFAFAGGSKDAAAIVNLPPGLYSVVVEGVNGATGVALAEVYDISK